jgi:3,4-dihydroxy 2-butanone 4-phosphate synthase/GTP cyclohydrolase II
MVRVHEPFTALDLLEVGNTAHSWPLPQALAAIQRAGRGVAVLLNCGHDAAVLLPLVLPALVARERRAAQVDLRTYGIGAQILRELMVTRMRLLGSPRRMPSMAGYALEVAEFVSA